MTACAGDSFPGFQVARRAHFGHTCPEAFAVGMILLVTLWPLVVALLVLPPIVGYWFDRRGSRNPSSGI